MSKNKKESPGTLGKNRKAYFNYTVEDSLECGIELKGTEVKSMRSSHFSFVDSFCEIRNNQLWMNKFSINPYDFGNIHNHITDRPRRLLAHTKEIEKLDRKIKEKGYTLIPLRFYLKGSLVKVEVGLCKGKKLFDKRETIKSRDLDRDMGRKSKSDD
ncbi:MAG: SsrA-binding protein SmpB [Spirochaetales bacterium]|nr:SsrA-binding protein SmpB [Spirochaetales bacterium]